MLQFLESVTIVLLLVLSVAIIVLFFVYTGLDKRRFRIERQLDKVLPLVRKWMSELRPLAADGVLVADGAAVAAACDQFLSTRKLMRRLDALSQLNELAAGLVCRADVELTEDQREHDANVQELQGMVRDFFSMYPIMADDYNKRIEKPVYKLGAKLMRFRPVPDLSKLEKA